MSHKFLSNGQGEIEPPTVKLLFITTIIIVSTIFFFYRDSLSNSTYPITFENYQHQTPTEYITQEALTHNLNPLNILLIAQCESRMIPEAINVNRNGTIDLGIFQINDVHNVPDKCRLNTKCSTDWAIKEIKKNGYGAWVCGAILGLKT